MLAADAPPDLHLVRLGTFSGIATSLRDALRGSLTVHDHDLAPLARTPSLLPARARAVFEARRGRDAIPWVKTAAWWAAVQRRLEAGQELAGASVLIVQTIPALLLPPRSYAVFTDRVAAEGRVNNRFRSRATEAWLMRERRMLMDADHIFCMGPSTTDVLADEYRVDPDRVTVVGGGPNIPIGQIRRREVCRRILFVGTQWELKGGPQLVAAFQKLRAAYTELRLTIVGSSPSVTDEGVDVVGRRSAAELTRFFEEADLFVMVSHIEAFGIAVIEALRHGLPVVVADTENLRWIAGDAAEFVAAGDVQALVAAIERTLLDYPARVERARRAADRLHDEMTWQRAADVVRERILDQA